MSPSNPKVAAAFAAAHQAYTSTEAFQEGRRKLELLSRIFQALIDPPATVHDYQKLAEVVRDAQEQNLEPEQIEARIRESTPFADLTRYLKDNHLAILSIVLTIVLYILSQQQPTKVEIVKPSIEDIIKQLEKNIGENPPAKPMPTGNNEKSASRK